MAEAQIIPGALKVLGPFFPLGGTVQTAVQSGIPLTRRWRFSVADVNNNVFLLPAVSYGGYRVIDFTVISNGGNAAGATSVTIVGTQGGQSVLLASIAIAALTRSTNVKPNSANVTMLADGAGTAVCDVNTPITFGSFGLTLTGTITMDVILTYAIEMP